MDYLRTPVVVVVTVLSAAVAHAQSEDRDTSLRRVCHRDGSRLLSAAARDGNLLAQLPEGSFVQLVGRVRGGDGDYLEVSYRGQRGYLAGDLHHLCYTTYAERRTCEHTGSSNLRPLPQPDAGPVTPVEPGSPLRYYGYQSGGYTYVKLHRQRGWQEGWIDTGVMCHPESIAGPPDVDAPLRRVCAETGSLLLPHADGRAQPVARLAHGTFVLLLGRTRGADGGEFLEVAVNGQRGMLPVTGHGLCHVTYAERRTCNGDSQGVPVRWEPSRSSAIMTRLERSHRLRFHGYVADGFAYVRFQHGGAWRTGWLDTAQICNIDPNEPDPGAAPDGSLGARLVADYLANYDLIRRQVGFTENACAAFASTALARVGVPVAYETWAPTLRQMIQRLGWPRITDPAQARPGDVVFTHDEITDRTGETNHVFVIEAVLGGGDVRALDNQGRSYRRSLHGGSHSPMWDAYRPR